MSEHIDLPVAVYGTLRPTGSRGWGWGDLATTHYDGDIFIPAYRIVDTGGFPYALPAPGDMTIGALMIPSPGRGTELMEHLDRIEGVPYLYVREQVTVYHRDGRRWEAWLYVVADTERAADLPPVPNNNWAERGVA